MITNLLLITGIVLLTFSALYLRYESRSLRILRDEMLSLHDDDYLYVYLAPEADEAYTLVVDSEDVLAQKMNAQWN